MGFFTYAKGVVSLTVALRVVDGRSEICTPNHLEKSPEIPIFSLSFWMLRVFQSFFNVLPSNRTLSKHWKAHAEPHVEKKDSFFIHAQYASE